MIEVDKQEKEKFVEPVCVRCGKSALDSGVPDICPKCARKMESLARKIDSVVNVRVLFMQGKSIDFILRKARRNALKVLAVIDEIERERKENDEVY